MADQEGARKSGKFIAVSLTPDVCKTPVGNTVVPVPYQISADFTDSMGTSPNVNFGGDPAFIYDKSQVTHVTGDEAGTAGGITSGTHKGIVEPIQASTTVRVNKNPVVRHGDLCKMNDGNTIGRIIYQGPSGGAPNTGDPNPPVKPETPEEVRAAEKINYPKLRRMLVRIQGAASGAYRDIHRLPQRRRRAKRQASWDNSFFPRP